MEGVGYRDAPNLDIAITFLMIRAYTGCSLNIVFFPQNVVIFLNSTSPAAALVFYLPGMCTHTDTEGKQRKVRVWNILKLLEKNHNI